MIPDICLVDEHRSAFVAERILLRVVEHDLLLLGKFGQYAGAQSFAAFPGRFGLCLNPKRSLGMELSLHRTEYFRASSPNNEAASVGFACILLAHEASLSHEGLAHTNLCSSR